MLSLGRGRAPDGIVCIGHSLGGAVAQLAALWLAQRFPRADLRVVTFGSPRVGNRAFKVGYPTLTLTLTLSLRFPRPTSELSPSAARASGTGRSRWNSWL